MMGQQAAEQLFASVELARRDIDLWVKLSERLEKLEQPAEAERARTSLVEMLPTETEGHAKLAEIRQSQERWDEADRTTGGTSPAFASWSRPACWD